MSCIKLFRKIVLYLLLPRPYRIMNSRRYENLGCSFDGTDFAFKFNQIQRAGGHITHPHPPSSDGSDTGDPRIVRVLRTQGIVLLRKSY